MTAAAEIPSILISDMGQHGEVSKALGVLGHADSAICCIGGPPADLTYPFRSDAEDGATCSLQIVPALIS